MMNANPVTRLKDNAPLDDEKELGMTLAEYVELAETDRKAAFAIFMVDSPEIEEETILYYLMEEAFDGYIEFLKKQFERV